MKKLFLGAMALSLLSVSCSKKETEAAAITPTEQNLAGTYKLTAATMGNTNYFDMMDACMKDDVYKLNSDMTYERVDAGSVCNPDNGETGDWDLIDSKTIEIGGVTQTIEFFNGTKLIASFDMGQGQVVKSTYMKQ